MTVTMAPVISICVQTYQHSAFINDCLEGILSQKTDYPYEILLGEDGSTDGTREICIDYARRHPDIIRLFLHDRKNVIYINGRPTGRYNFLHNLNRASGKYIAICEGDDYWTDNFKLQKQVSFLESNPDYSICFHAVDILRNNKIVEDYLTVEKKINTDIFELAKGNYIHTPSVLYRNCLPQPLPDFIKMTPVGDYPVHMLVAEHGKIRYFPEKMAMYRVHDGGIYSTRHYYEKLYGFLAVLKPLIAYFENNTEVRNILIEQRFRNYIQLLHLCREGSYAADIHELFKQLCRDEPALLMEHLFDIKANLEETRLKEKDLAGKYRRMINHPVVGRVIRLCSLLKHDKSFGQFD